MCCCNALGGFTIGLSGACSVAGANDTVAGTGSGAWTSGIVGCYALRYLFLFKSRKVIWNVTTSIFLTRDLPLALSFSHGWHVASYNAHRKGEMNR